MITRNIGNLACTLVCAVMVASSWPVAAVDSSYPSDRELRLLPRFCSWKLRGDKAQKERGFRLLGEQFKNSHHYCAGLNFLRRYYRNPSGPEARSFLHMAVNEFTYMIEHLVPNSSLAGHSYLARGKAHVLAGEDSLAMKDLREAVRYNPRLSAAYAAWADLLTKRGLTADAVKVLKQGLERRPGSKLLKRRLLRLQEEGSR